MSATQKSQLVKRTVRLTDAITRPANTTAYAANDVVSEVTTNDHFTFTDAKLGTSGEIVHALITSSDAVATSLDGELYLFSADIAEVADNSALALTDAEMVSRLGVIDFATGNWKIGKAGAGGTSGCEVSGLSIPFTASSAGDGSGFKLYGQLVAQNAYVPVSGEIFTVTLTVRLDS